MKPSKIPILSASILIALILCSSGASDSRSDTIGKTPVIKTIYVYPVHISKITREESFDTIIARRIVDFINEKGDYKAVFINSTPAVNAEWFMNEAKMLKKSGQAFSEYLKTHDQPEGYALLVEFLWLPYEIVVHFSLAEKSSGVVLRGLANSHHPAHKEIMPKNNDDAYKLFCRIFTDRINNSKL